MSWLPLIMFSLAILGVFAGGYAHILRSHDEQPRPDVRVYDGHMNNRRCCGGRHSQRDSLVV